MVFPRDLHRRFRGLRPAGYEKHPAHSFWGQVGDLSGQVDLRLADELSIGEGDLPGLFGHGLGDFLYAVADADDVHPRAGIQVGHAFRIIQVAPPAV